MIIAAVVGAAFFLGLYIGQAKFDKEKSDNYDLLKEQKKTIDAFQIKTTADSIRIEKLEKKSIEDSVELGNAAYLIKDMETRLGINN